jgi:beta-aspartyl-peptidase (threonine type)
MKIKILLSASLLLSALSQYTYAIEAPIAIAIHGGAGTIEKSRFTPEK